MSFHKCVWLVDCHFFSRTEEGKFQRACPFFVLYCLDDTDLNISQFIRPAARGRCKDVTIRLGVRHLSYSFRDVQGLLLDSA